MKQQPDSEKNRSLSMEGFWTLLGNLQLRNNGAPPRSILVTSGRPGEGKSTIAANLAVTVANGGKRVLLVDADLRRPSLHERFNVANEQGLSEFLTGASTDVYWHSLSANLSLLPAGRELANQPRLMNSDAMRELIETKTSGYDLVLFDSAPVLAVSDALLLSSLVEGVVLVLAANEGTETEARTTKARLDQAGARLLGTVLNRFDETEVDAYHPYAAEYVK